MSRRISVNHTIALSPSEYYDAKVRWDGPIARDHEEAQYGWGWFQDGNGNWCLGNQGEGTDEQMDVEMFQDLASVVPEGQYIGIHDEYGNHWRYYFDGTGCLLQEGVITYEA